MKYQLNTFVVGSHQYMKQCNKRVIALGRLRTTALSEYVSLSGQGVQRPPSRSHLECSCHESVSNVHSLPTSSILDNYDRGCGS